MKAPPASRTWSSMGGPSILSFMLLGAVSVHAAPIPTASTHFLNFGPVPVGEQSVLPIEFGNAGDEPWVVDGLEFLGGQRSEFDVLEGLGGFVLLPGEHIVRNIIFGPAATGVRAAYLHTITQFPIPQLLVQVMGVGTSVAGIGDGTVAKPHGLRLGPPTPNPARGRLSVEIEGAIAAGVTLGIYDAAGRQIRSLVHELEPLRRGRIDWDGRTARGDLAPAGIYLLRLESGGEVAFRTAVLLR